MKFVALIPTYNRPHELGRLLEQLTEAASHLPGSLSTVVLDDGSTPPAACSTPNVRIIRNPSNMGKQGYWRTINRLANTARELQADYVIHLADDLTLRGPKALRSAYFTMRSLGQRAILNLLTDRRGICSQWTGKQPRRIAGRIWETGWIDGAFMAPARMWRALDRIRPIPSARWRRRPQISSGVWEQASIRLVRAGWRLCHHEVGFLQHEDGGDSRMHPSLRASCPL